MSTDDNPPPLKPGAITPNLPTKTTPLDVRGGADTGSSTREDNTSKDTITLSKKDQAPLTQPRQPPTPLSNDIAAYLSPLSKELNALPSEYENAISQINDILPLLVYQVKRQMQPTRALYLLL
jgi:hypothetical protein